MLNFEQLILATQIYEIGGFFWDYIRQISEKQSNRLQNTRANRQKTARRFYFYFQEIATY